jgi:chromatin assembly factor 1 subunit A
MQPPRLPLQASNQTNIMLSPYPVVAEAQQQSATSTENRSPATKPSFDQQNPRAQTKALRLMPNELLPSFKQAVSGSDLNKVGLVEILKKQYAISFYLLSEVKH